MRVLVACEFSGVVRRAFWKAGHVSWSCDLLPAEDGSSNHYQRDIFSVIKDCGPWDLMIAHPPCTHLAVSGAAHFSRKIASGEQGRALDFVQRLFDAPIKKKCIENPVSIISTKIKKPTQIIQPWMFGHPEQKTTCLWLEGLPPLEETDNVREEMLGLPKNKRERLHYLPPGPDRWKERSRTFQGIANAMANQWGNKNG